MRQPTEPRSEATTSRPTRPGSLLPALLALVALLVGCEWGKYWERSPTAPPPPPPPPPNNEGLHVAIAFPPDSFRVATRGTLPLAATAFDEDEGDLAPEQVAWSSNVDGALGTGLELELTNLLTPGFHILSATATNSLQGTVSDSITLEVLAEPTYSYCEDLRWHLFEAYFCTFCHDPATSEYPNSELSLLSWAELMEGGKTTIVRCVAPCRPESSLVLNKITENPPWVGDPMPNPDIFPTVPEQMAERLRVWILEGAPPDDPEECP